MVIVDSSVWIDYFRGGNLSGLLDDMIDENVIAINDLILAELIPFLKIRNQNSIIRLLQNIQKLNMAIDWEEIIEFQYQCLKIGLNGVGIPDLIICQNAMQHQSAIYSIDSHFRHMQDIRLCHHIIDKVLGMPAAQKTSTDDPSSLLP